MRKETALKVVMCISIAGMLFSGFLTYNEMFRGSCAIGGCSYVLGFPACVYGFVMYAIVFIICLLGLYYGETEKKRKK